MLFPVCNMTTVLVKKTAGRYTGFTFSGHAGFAKAGRDIVCSAISVLVINTINAMESLADAQMEVVTNEAEGIIDVVFTRPVNEKTILLLDTMLLGLNSIQNTYGRKYLKLKFEEV